MPTPAGQPSLPCPSCRQPMQTENLERNAGGTIPVDLCFTCSGFWFDRMASVELAPAAVMQLFKEINQRRDAGRQPVATRLNCPRCEDALVESFDLVKSGRFSYFRCVRGDGRFTPFYQFLREKQFVRSLTAAELQHVRAEVKQVNCSQCGAPIDLTVATACPFCHAPISLLDPDAVQHAVQMWTAAEQRRRLAPGAQDVANALLQVQRGRAQQPADFAARGGLAGLFGTGTGSYVNTGIGVDLVDLGIRALANLFE